MTTLAQAPTRKRITARASALDRFVLPVASLLVVLTVLESGARVLLTVALPVVVLAAFVHRFPRGVAAAITLLLGSLVGGAALIARKDWLLVAALLYLLAGLSRAWGTNRGRDKRRAWINRALATAGAILVAFLIVYPTLIAVDYLAKPRASVDEAALRLPHERVAFAASDGVHLAGWYVPSRNGAAVVLVHGGGGDRQGTIRHARMLAHAGYGVLLYDARGRGESKGHENGFGWQWDRDVHGAVSYLARRGIDRIGLLGLSTGAEAVVTEAASDRRVEAIVADGLQARTAADAGHLGLGDRISLQPAFAVAGLEIELVTGQTKPKPLIDLVHDVARTRPLLLIGTVSFERDLDRAYVRGTDAQLWELPHTAHTRGLEDHPREYSARVLALFDRALG